MTPSENNKRDGEGISLSHCVSDHAFRFGKNIDMSISALYETFCGSAMLKQYQIGPQFLDPILLNPSKQQTIIISALSVQSLRRSSSALCPKKEYTDCDKFDLTVPGVQSHQ